MRFHKCEFCKKLGFSICEFCKNWDFQYVNFWIKGEFLPHMISYLFCLDTQILGVELSHRIETGTRAIPPDIRQKCLHFPRHSRAIAKGIRAYERRSLPK